MIRHGNVADLARAWNHRTDLAKLKDDGYIFERYDRRDPPFPRRYASAQPAPPLKRASASKLSPGQQTEITNEWFRNAPSAYSKAPDPPLVQHPRAGHEHFGFGKRQTMTFARPAAPYHKVPDRHRPEFTTEIAERTAKRPSLRRTCGHSEPIATVSMPVLSEHQPVPTPSRYVLVGPYTNDQEEPPE